MRSSRGYATILFLLAPLTFLLSLLRYSSMSFFSPFSLSRVVTAHTVAAACALLLFTACEPVEQQPDTSTPSAHNHASTAGDTPSTTAQTPAATNSAQQQNTETTEPASELPPSALLKIEQPWIRAAVKGQSGTGGFLKITPSQDLELVGFSTDVAEVNEIHEMVMDGDVMKMSAIPSLALPAGQTTELKPGSYHLMLMKLKQPLKDGETIQLTLMVKDNNAVVSTFPVTASIKLSAATPDGMAHGDMTHGDDMKHDSE